MIRKQISAMLICLLLATFTAPFVRAQTDDYTKVRAQAVKYENKKKSVKVEMRIGYTQKGRISRAGSDSFDLTDSKTGKVSTILYKDVAGIKRGGLSVGTIAAIAGLAAGGIIITSLLLVRCRNEGGC